MCNDDDTQNLAAVFGVVEWILAEGDPEARSLITEGFLDDLTNTSSTSNVDEGVLTRPHAGRRRSRR
jgi:hypothetical protein